MRVEIKDLLEEPSMLGGAGMMGGLEQML